VSFQCQAFVVGYVEPSYGVVRLGFVDCFVNAFEVAAVDVPVKGCPPDIKRIMTFLPLSCLGVNCGPCLSDTLLFLGPLPSALLWLSYPFPRYFLARAAFTCSESSGYLSLMASSSKLLATSDMENSGVVFLRYRSTLMTRGEYADILGSLDP
jgi:hypothetical protein